MAQNYYDIDIDDCQNQSNNHNHHDHSMDDQMDDHHHNSMNDNNGSSTSHQKLQLKNSLSNSILNGMVSHHDDNQDSLQQSNSLNGDNNSINTVPLAVKVQNVAYFYNKKKPVLKNVTLNIPEGKIFALLGSNGCGKTTMLRMILGRLKPKTGFIRVFGVQPGSKHSRIPGPGVGYMPQEISLIPEFTIEETLKYFGRIYHMDKRDVYKRIGELFELLSLPHPDKLIRELSGGQKRLVSLAVTLIHQAPLVILDEPTVGVDSVLRYRIWMHLVQLCKKEGTSVIITTHYIEEAKEADMVGFIESGTILAQSTPKKLQEQFQCKTLEEVFLKLCISRYSNKSNNNNNNNTNNNNNSDSQTPKRNSGPIITPKAINFPTRSNHKSYNLNNNNNYQPNEQYHQKYHQHTHQNQQPHPQLQQLNNYEEYQGEKMSLKELIRKEMDQQRLMAMIWKSYIRVKRNPFVLIMFHMIPVVTITLFTLTFLRSPHSMPIAIYPGDKQGGNLSRTFIDIMDDYFLKKNLFETPDQALQSVRDGHSYYAMVFTDNFTEAFTSRYIDVFRSSVEDQDIESSKIKLYPDNSNFIFAVYMRRAVLNYFETFMKKFSSDLGYNPITFNLPIYLKEPIYGKMETDLGHYLVSALLVFSLYALPMVIGSLLIVMDRKDGYQERAFVAGVKPLEILSGHMLTCFLAVLSQVFLTLMLTFLWFELDNEGSLFEIFILIFLQGIQGLSIGLVISTICVDEIFAFIAVISLIIPMLLTSGSMWPMEGLPDFIQKLVYLNPITLTIRSVRLVMLRGWSYQHFEVLIGYLTTSTYTVICFITSIILFHLISNSTIRIPFLPHYQ